MLTMTQKEYEGFPYSSPARPEGVVPEGMLPDVPYVMTLDVQTGSPSFGSTVLEPVLIVADRVYDLASTEGDSVKWREFIAAMNSGEPVEIDAEMSYRWLEIIPPVFQQRTLVNVQGIARFVEFGFAEGPEPVRFFWHENRPNAGHLSHRPAFRYFVQKGQWNDPGEFFDAHREQFPQLDRPRRSRENIAFGGIVPPSDQPPLDSGDTFFWDGQEWEIRRLNALDGVWTLPLGGDGRSPGQIGHHFPNPRTVSEDFTRLTGYRLNAEALKHDHNPKDQPPRPLKVREPKENMTV